MQKSQPHHNAFYSYQGVQNNHHYTNDTGSTIEAVFGAGMDSNCGGYTQSNTVTAVESGSAKLGLYTF